MPRKASSKTPLTSSTQALYTAIELDDSIKERNKQPHIIGGKNYLLTYP